jgi:hypothetical protein
MGSPSELAMSANTLKTPQLASSLSSSSQPLEAVACNSRAKKQIYCLQKTLEMHKTENN